MSTNDVLSRTSGSVGYYDQTLFDKQQARRNAASQATNSKVAAPTFHNNTVGQSPDTVELSDYYKQLRDNVAGTGIAEDGSVVSLTLSLCKSSTPVEKKESEVFKYYTPVSHAEEMRIRFASMERALGLENGSLFDKHYGDMIKGNAPIDMDKQNALWTKQYIDDYYAHEQDFADSQKQVNADRADINDRLSSLFNDAGLSQAQQKNLSISLNADGTFVINGLDGDSLKAAEDVLTNNRDLVDEMLKTSAMQSSINLDYIKETEESLGIEMTLVDLYLKEQVGYGVDDLDIFRLHSDKTDPALRELLDNDQLLERQIYRYGERKASGFTNNYSSTWKL